MRAYILNRYGGPDGSQLMDVPAPVPGPSDILVNVRAAGLNPVDFKFRQGKLKVIYSPKLPFVLGNELAGEVAAVGSAVTRFKARAANVDYRYLFMHPSGSELAELGDLITQVRMKVIVDKAFPFAQMADALAYVESGRAKGKVVVEM
ncbi:MAG: zinc-binding dehydrogenase [Pseudomonadota bacterium]